MVIVTTAGLTAMRGMAMLIAQPARFSLLRHCSCLLNLVVGQHINLGEFHCSLLCYGISDPFSGGILHHWPLAFK